MVVVCILQVATESMDHPMGPEVGLGIDDMFCSIGGIKTVEPSPMFMFSGIMFPHLPAPSQTSPHRPREMKTTLELIEKDLEKQAELRAGHKPADDSEAEDGVDQLGVVDHPMVLAKMSKKMSKPVNGCCRNHVLLTFAMIL